MYKYILLHHTKRVSSSNKNAYLKNSSIGIARTLIYCNNTLPRGGMYWKIRPPRIERFAEAGILHHEVREIAKGEAWGLFWEIRMFSYFKGYFEGYFKGYFEGWGPRNPCWGISRGWREAYFQLILTRGGVLAFFFSREGMYWKMQFLLGSILKITSSHGILLINIVPRGKKYRKLHPKRLCSIDNVKFNLSCFGKKNEYSHFEIVHVFGGTWAWKIWKAVSQNC